MHSVNIIDRGRGPELEGTRFTVYNLMPYYLAGDEPAQIAEWTRLSLAQVQALIRYIEEHRDEVMAVHQQIEERIARGNPPEIEAKLAGSRAKLQARLAELKKGRRMEERNGAGDSC